jgi:hypothetical protein
MIHYHGLPITPSTAAVKAIEHGHAFVSFAHQDQLPVAVSVASSFAIDNGAFSAWRAGFLVKDWFPYYTWVENCKRIPSCDFAVIPDVIDGDEKANDELLAEWDFPKWFGAPVWHMHESMHRLKRLIETWPRVCIGSSGEFSTIGTTSWWSRMAQAMRVVCNDDGQPSVKLHGLRMLDPLIFSRLPLTSADSTNIGRNVGIDKNWRGSYLPPTKEARATVMRSRIESHNAPPIWNFDLPINTTVDLFA